MIIDENIVDLICELEYIVGRQCYNPNSYNGWTGEEGCSFRYPVSFCKSKEALEKGVLTKERGAIKYIEPEMIATVKYAFGSNHIYIGDAIKLLLENIEKRYAISFNDLEKIRIEKNDYDLEKAHIQKRDIEKRLERKEVVQINQNCIKVGKDIPAGSYLLICPKSEDGNHVLTRIHICKKMVIKNKLYWIGIERLNKYF